MSLLVSDDIGTEVKAYITVAFDKGKGHIDDHELPLSLSFLCPGTGEGL
jgi:hypothetical protein